MPPKLAERFDLKTGGGFAPLIKHKIMKRGALSNNYFYYGRAITFATFLANVDEEDYVEWLHSGENRILNDYSWGGYTAKAVTDENGELI